MVRGGYEFGVVYFVRVHSRAAPGLQKAAQDRQIDTRTQARGDGYDLYILCASWGRRGPRAGGPRARNLITSRLSAPSETSSNLEDTKALARGHETFRPTNKACCHRPTKPFVGANG